MSQIRSRAFIVALAGLAVVAVGCGSDNIMGPSMGPMSGVSGTSGLTTLMSVSPSGNAVGVSLSSPIVIRFSYAMGVGMEQFVDLHMGDLSGPVVPWSCGWSPDRTTLTCMPSSPLQPRTRYSIHIGAGMMDGYGRSIDMTQYGMGLGGQWAYPGPMGSVHAGMPWSGMRSGWQGPNGSYGMAFVFETA